MSTFEHPDPAVVAENLLTLQNQVKSLAEEAGRSNVRLVPVSKTKPVSLIQACYDAGQKRFAENYVHEIVEKHSALPDDVEWVFCGHLQSNKVKDVAPGVPNLCLIETVSSLKLAKEISKQVTKARKDSLDVFVQVNTSGEESKHGATPETTLELCKEVHAIENLNLKGLMTIGRPNAGPDQPDFVTMVELKTSVCEELNLDKDTFELSMGMTNDFADAIKFGSTNVRVGSAIFGARYYAPGKGPNAAK